MLGSLLGVAIAWWGTDALRAVPMPGGLPIRLQTQVDLVTLTFAVLLGVACGAICGAAPALQLSGVDPSRALRAGARLSAPSVLRSALMGVQVALALIVLVVAALFLRNFVQTGSEDTGFRKEGVLLAAYDLTGRIVDDRVFAARVLASLRELPGVESAAIATSVPLDIHGLPSRTFTLEGRARTDGGTDRAASNTVTPGYFRTMGIPFRAGSDFADLDDAIAPPQAIVNEAFVDRYLQQRRTDRPPPDVRPPHLRHHRRRPHVTLRFVRRAADAGDLFLVSRSSVGHGRDAPARRGRAARRRSASR